ncbi:DMT family transporter [Pseudorhodobacter ferrugineus]|uniref:DMT family transporter n=1 Tax=Pseudorhodobacter ferrugineus TaxID=77008 RepID=UPI0003F589B7|nr:DMT family transporter [Pseudorhodobacter ferrugineus]
MTPNPIPPTAVKPLAGLLLGFAGVVIFGATLPATRIALGGFDPAFITFGRACLAGLASAIALLIARKRFPRDDLGAFALIGVTLVFGFPAFVNVAMQTVPASHGGIVLGVLPLLTAVFAAVIGGEKPGLAFWLWGVAGAALVLGFTLRGGGFVPGVGYLWLGCAAIVSAFGYVVSGKLSRKLPGWEVIAWALVLCLPLTGLGSALTWGAGVHAPSHAALWAMAYLAFGSMFAGFFFWNAGLALGGIARVGQVQLLQTFVTLAISAWLLDEQITPVMLVFACAVALVVWCGRKARVA